MNDHSGNILTAKMPSALEMNNNSQHISTIYRSRSDSRNSSLSSASSNDTSEESVPVEVTDEIKSRDGDDKIPDNKRFRSMSDGAPRFSSEDEPFQVFPSLPDAVLEKMGLMGGTPRERLNEEDLEQKFVALALAFSIDAATIDDRFQRQRRYRDQTEKNLLVEIDRLIDKANKMQTLCIDAETTELLTDLLAQIDVIMKASSHATISAERFGAVQHEERLAQSVHLMINHVSVLKQQRDSARKHLQYTKRVLQNTSSTDEAIKQRSPLLTAPTLNKRRASIANITQQKSTGSIDLKRISRRPSDMSFRATSLPRATRPSRLELGVDLVKIREGTIEGNETPQVEDCRKMLTTPEEENVKETILEASPVEQIIYSELPMKEKLLYKVHKLNELATIKYQKLADNGTLQEIFTVGTFLCFALSVISLGNIFIEVEYAKRNLTENYGIREMCCDLLTYFRRFYGEHPVIT